VKGLLIFFIIFLGISAHAQTTPEVPQPLPDRDFKILYKPRPGYPDKAGCVTGTVILRIAFLESGKIGPISVVKGLPTGLTEKALEAAEKIQFQTMIRVGEHKSVTKQVEYFFSY
jgi:hypothetical protein